MANLCSQSKTSSSRRALRRQLQPLVIHSPTPTPNLSSSTEQWKFNYWASQDIPDTHIQSKNYWPSFILQSKTLEAPFGGVNKQPEVLSSFWERGFSLRGISFWPSTVITSILISWTPTRSPTFNIILKPCIRKTDPTKFIPTKLPFPDTSLNFRHSQKSQLSHMHQLSLERLRFPILSTFSIFSRVQKM